MIDTLNRDSENSLEFIFLLEHLSGKEIPFCLQLIDKVLRNRLGATVC